MIRGQTSAELGWYLAEVAGGKIQEARRHFLRKRRNRHDR